MGEKNKNRWDKVQGTRGLKKTLTPMLCKNSKTGCTKLKINVSYTVGKEIECRLRKYRGLLCWHFVFMWKNDVIT